MPLPPLNNMTPRKAAVWFNRVTARCCEGIATHCVSDKGPKGTAVAPQVRVYDPGIQFQLDLESPQSEIHFVEVVVDAHGPIFAHDSVDAGVEEPVQVQLRIQGTQEWQSPGEAILRTFADTVVMARVIDL